MGGAHGASQAGAESVPRGREAQCSSAELGAHVYGSAGAKRMHPVMKTVH